MSNNTIIVPTDGVKGDITSCEITTQLISTKRDSMFSFQEMNTYVSYDVCNKQILREYSIPSWTGFGFIASCVLVVIGFSIINSIGNRY